jgi:hypothetical protein
VDGTQVGILEKANKVGLSGFLKSQDGRTLETKIGLEILGNLTDKTLEGQLADEQIGTLLVATNLTESDGSGTVTMGLLDSSGGGGRLTGSLGGELLSGSLSSGGFTCGLFVSRRDKRNRVSHVESATEPHITQSLIHTNLLGTSHVYFLLLSLLLYELS